MTVVDHLDLLQCEHQATLNQLPNLQAFDPANRAASLRPSSRSIPETPAPTPQMSELGHLSTLVTALVSAIKPGLVTPSRQAPAPSESHPIHATQLVTPSKPSEIAENLIPSPSDLTRFLDYASTNLGVRNAKDFESPLRRKGYGPDILPQVSDSALTALGITEGDVLRLKHGSTAWWNGPNAKRKRAGSDLNSTTEVHDDNTHENKRCHYEYRYPDGSGYVRYNGPPPVAGERQDRDHFTRMQDKVTRKMLPIPDGFSAPAYDDPEIE